MKLRIALPVLLAVACLLSGCMESDEEKYEKALSLYTKSTSNQQAIQSAHQLLEELAGKGHPKAEYMLARMYHRGDGVIQDNAKALALLLSSSAHGNGDASYLASDFYTLPKYGQTPDPEKAKTLLFKSARDGSEIGQLSLGDKYFYSAPGYQRDVKLAHDELVRIKDGPYRDAAALTLYKIYSLPNQPLYSPEKATKEMERLAASTKKPLFIAQLAGIYAGKEFVGEASVVNPEKLNALISEHEKTGSQQLIALMKFRADLLPAGEFLPTMLAAIKEPAVDPVFGKVFCQAVSGLYTGEKRDPSLDINDIVKACRPDAELNNNYAQYILAVAYFRQKQYDEAYKWAFVSGLNGNQYAVTLAKQIGAGYLGARVEEVSQDADNLNKTLKNVKSKDALDFDYSLPWYSPAATTVQ